MRTRRKPHFTSSEDNQHLIDGLPEGTGNEKIR